MCIKINIGNTSPGNNCFIINSTQSKTILFCENSAYSVLGRRKGRKRRGGEGERGRGGEGERGRGEGEGVRIFNHYFGTVIIKRGIKEMKNLQNIHSRKIKTTPFGNRSNIFNLFTFN